MKQLFFTIFSIIFFANTAFAQQEMTLHLMNNIYQSSYTNPALLQSKKVTLGLPAISSIHMGFKNSGFALEDINAGTNKDLVVDLDMLNDQLKARESMFLGGSADIFSLRFPVNDNNWVSFSVRENFSTRLGYGSGLLSLVTEGNPVGETLDIGGYKLNALHYREYAAGYTRKIPGLGLTVGGNLKLVYGKANINTKRSQLSLNTADESELYKITGSADYLVNFGGFDPKDSTGINTTDYLMNNANAGLGLDLGATYKLNEKISFGASIIDIGYIKWTENVRNYRAQGEFEFDGFNYDNILNSNGGSQQDFTDSLDQIIDVTQDSTGYTSALPTQVYLTGNYKLSPKTTASAVIHGDFIGKFRGAFGLGIVHEVANALNVAATYSIQNRSAANLGLGIMLKPGPLQFYIAGDNFLSLLRPTKSKMLNARMGINLVFGNRE